MGSLKPREVSKEIKSFAIPIRWTALETFGARGPPRAPAVSKAGARG